MSPLAVDLGLGIVVFAATNLDDLLLLAAFFGAARMDRRAIVAGQFLGIGTLFVSSVLAARLALELPAEGIALLGLAPLILGLAKLRGLRRGPDEESPAGGAHPEASSRERPTGQSVAVAAVTLANGGDNLGAWIPLFAHSPGAVATHAISFAVLTGLWCLAGAWLAGHPVIGVPLRRYGHVALPLVLIGLGLHILAGAWPPGA